MWGKKQSDLIPHADTQILEGLSRIIKANSFIADATLDNLVFTSRLMAAGNHARRAIWLRAWQTDPKSKQIVAAYPFTGDKLFGVQLDMILVKMRDKKKLLPKSLKRTDKGTADLPYHELFLLFLLSIHQDTNGQQASLLDSQITVPLAILQREREQKLLPKKPGSLLSPGRNWSTKAEVVTQLYCWWEED